LIPGSVSSTLEGMKRLLISFLVLAAAACAADITGTWKGTAEGPQGALERTFTFKVEGSKLTGETTSQMMGKSVINDGKVDGDDVSFTITANLQGNELKLAYKGKVSGDELKLTSEAAGGGAGFGAIQWVCKREK
jgi:hypothetical protein